jgi:hypothetical protein
MRHALRVALAASLITMAAIAGCSGGGGGSSPNPAPPGNLPGAGSTVAINQRITFTIEVPPNTGASGKQRAAAGTTRHAAAATPTPGPPYLSPATAAIVLTLAEIDGISPQKAAPTIPTIPVRCSNCTFSVPNIPAALGTDRYFVQTYSGYANGQATGNLISTGFVDVDVPAKNPATLGGAAVLSVGGYVAAINLAPGTISFDKGTAGNQNILVSALDPGGATIVGSVLYAYPIVVSVLDTANYSLDGAPTDSLSGTLTHPIVLHYTGGPSFGTEINATSTNENGVVVNASPIAVGFVIPTLPPGQTPTPAPPTPTPTLPPKTTSLYVADTVTDTVSEYAFVAQLESGNVPNPVPTPKRVMQFNPQLVNLGPSDSLSCAQALEYNGVYIPPGEGNGTVGVAIGTDGTIFMLPTCVDSNSNSYIFGYPATTVGGGTPPSIIDPVAADLNAVPQPEALGLVTTGTQSTVYSEFLGQQTDGSAESLLFGTPTSTTGKQPTIAIGSTCFQEFGYNPCQNGPNNRGIYGAFAFEGDAAQDGGFGLDPVNGFAFMPTYWQDIPTGDAATLYDPGALLAVPDTTSDAIVNAQFAITGINSDIGGYEGEPIASTVDNGVLYVLFNPLEPGVLTDGHGNPTGAAYYPGVSSCPPPSSNAPVNTPQDPNNPVTQCADADGSPVQHSYIAAFNINSLGGFEDIDPTPNFIIGGDVVGGFGCSPNNGQYLAASAGFVYVINFQKTCPGGTIGPAAPEIDVYNTNNVSGFHTDIPPILTVPLQSNFPVALAIGPSGTVSGGQSLIRHPLGTLRPYRFHRRAIVRRPRLHFPLHPGATPSP